LQWKGQQEEFETLALEFAEKFEISPPGWEESGVMDLSLLHKDTSDDVETLELDKNLNINNVNPMLDWIKDKFDKKQNVEVDFSNIERVDFSAAGAISFHIQELWSNPDNQSRTVTFKYPNELIIVLLEMVGVTEFVSIIPRVRK
jgi:ABC-type transporter Mla MlaB component